MKTLFSSPDICLLWSNTCCFSDLRDGESWKTFCSVSRSLLCNTWLVPISYGQEQRKDCVHSSTEGSSGRLDHHILVSNLLWLESTPVSHKIIGNGKYMLIWKKTFTGFHSAQTAINRRLFDDHLHCCHLQCEATGPKTFDLWYMLIRWRWGEMKLLLFMLHSSPRRNSGITRSTSLKYSICKPK